MWDKLNQEELKEAVAYYCTHVKGTKVEQVSVTYDIEKGQFAAYVKGAFDYRGTRTSKRDNRLVETNGLQE